MPTGHIMNQAFIKQYERLAEEMTLEGLTKIVAKGMGTGLLFVSPDEISPEEFKSMDDAWNQTHEGPYPLSTRMCEIWMPKDLQTRNNRQFHILRAYSPIRLHLPEGQNETWGGLKTRIESESMRVVQYVRDEFEGMVNAYYMGNINTEFVIDEAIREVMPIIGRSFLQKQGKDILIPRITYDLQLFQIEEQHG